MSSEHAGGVPHSIEFAGHVVTIDVAARDDMVRVRATMPMSRDGASLLADELVGTELGMPGDGSARIDGNTLVFERGLIDPSPTRARAVAYELAKRAVQFVQTLEQFIAANHDFETRSAVAPPVFAPPLADVAAVLGCYYTVRVPQNGWEIADPALPPTAVLGPGHQYFLIERIGDWARVEGPPGTVLFTDGRTLMQVQEGAQ